MAIVKYIPYRAIGCRIAAVRLVGHLGNIPCCKRKRTGFAKVRTGKRIYFETIEMRCLEEFQAIAIKAGINVALVFGGQAYGTLLIVFVAR